MRILFVLLFGVVLTAAFAQAAEGEESKTVEVVQSAAPADDVKSQDAQALLDVDAGVAKEGDSERQTRQFGFGRRGRFFGGGFGGGFGGFGGFGHRPFGFRPYGGFHRPYGFYRPYPYYRPYGGFYRPPFYGGYGGFYPGFYG